MNIREIALSWVGTPFFPHMSRKGVGADCVSQALSIYQEAGALPEGITLPEYNISDTESRCLEWINSSGLFVKSETIEEGSLLTFRIDRIVKHAGVAIDPIHFVHNIRGYGAIVSRIDDSTWKKRLETIFRLKQS